MESITELKQIFLEKYSGDGQEIRSFYAPGRVNLIGEHTDYNGGYVFPAALTFGTTMLIRKRNDQRIRFASVNFPLEKELNLEDLHYDDADGWINYPKAILVHLKKEGYHFSGYDLLFSGDIPGSGLSSSASIQLVSAFGFMSMEGHPINKIELALTAQASENQFLGVNCGIMDQFTVAMGEENQALLLKCDTLDYRHVPLEMEGVKLVIGNTNKKRGLVDSEYNARRSQCEQAVKYLQAQYPKLEFLAEISAEQFEEAKYLIPDETIQNRARHVIEENDRVLASVEALEDNQLDVFGRFMNDSHDSLRDLYEVSCKELDVIVEEARQISGVLGSRMTGAGFGGCTVSLVKESSVDEFIEKVGKAYAAQTDYQADFYVCQIGGGVRELN